MTAQQPLAERALQRAADTERIPRVADAVSGHLGDDSSGHDMAHVWRVFLLGTRLAEAVGADREIVQLAALTHDVHRSLGPVGEFVHPSASLPEVRSILETAGVEPGPVRDVLHCVEVHDEYGFREGGRPVETLEAEVLRDADNLDAMGAVGIARAFAFAGVVDNPLWDPTGDRYSGLGHFEDKLLHLRDELHTEPARALAVERHQFLEAFKTRFEAEWFGEA